MVAGAVKYHSAPGDFFPRDAVVTRIMSLRLHEISESNHRILNPLSESKLMLLGEICCLQPDMRQLDLCCGKGEMLCQWAHRWKIRGVGVDISKVFLAAARQRAVELSVEDRVILV